MLNTDAIIIHQFNIGESLRNVLYCASFKQSLNKLSYYYKHTQTVPIWQHPACLSWCTSLGLPVAQTTSCLMLRTGQQQSTRSYRWNLQGGKKTEFSIKFSAQNLSFRCTKKKFYSMHNYIWESKKRRTHSYLFDLDSIYIYKRKWEEWFLFNVFISRTHLFDLYHWNRKVVIAPHPEMLIRYSKLFHKAVSIFLWLFQ